MTGAPTRIRVHGGRVAHAVTAYPGGRLRTECAYDLGVGDVSRHGHCALPADAAVTCRACLKELARKEVPPGPGGDAQAESEPRCESRHPEHGLLCTLPAGHDTHRHVGDVWLDSDYGDTISVSGKVDALAEIAAADIPLIRAQVADEIEAATPEVTVLTSTQVIYQANGMRHAARIARGDQ